ncbi:MAG TPA: hypothetical protein V6D30_08175 [Leptolyngbyaceae cyanobacterium]
MQATVEEEDSGFRNSNGTRTRAATTLHDCPRLPAGVNCNARGRSLLLLRIDALDAIAYGTSVSVARR